MEGRRVEKETMTEQVDLNNYQTDRETCMLIKVYFLLDFDEIESRVALRNTSPISFKKVTSVATHRIDSLYVPVHTIINSWWRAQFYAQSS